ncbi:hypothetical protein [Reyranella sp.]|uniref:hypothetical protein n=1 Tax=Reyranella sp. TaxID=1929291 RepID=UPI003D12DCC6
MNANSTAQVETLHPRPAGKPAAARSPRKRKAKATTPPLHGWQRLDEIMRRGLTDARATSGLASGLHELFAIRLAEAEENLAMLGRSSDDTGPRFAQQLRRTEDLRTWVGVLAALKERASRAESFAGKAAERVGWAVRREGAR